MSRNAAVVALAVALALSPAGAQESGKPAWHLEFHDNSGAAGFTAVVKLDPGLSIITVCGHEEGRPTREVGRRTLTPEEDEIVKNALARFSRADLEPIYSNLSVDDGYQIRVDFVAPDGRESRVRVENVVVPELNTLIATISPLLPPTPTGRPALVPFVDESPPSACKRP